MHPVLTRAQARTELNRVQQILFLSELTMTHDIVGETSPDPTETLKEKKILAKKLLFSDLSRQVDSLHPFWARKKIKQIKELANAINDIA